MHLTSRWLTPLRDAPLLVVGPSLGTSAAQLWRACVDGLTDLADVAVVAWELPGHDGRPVPDGLQVEVAALAEGVREVAVRAADELAVRHGRPAERTVAYAGDSLGGAVGLQLLLDAPDLVTGAVLVSTGAAIGTPGGWAERAATVRSAGMTAVLDGSVERWFAARTRSEKPHLVDELVATLRGVDPEGYARCCEALARFDVTSRLSRIGAPVLAVAGAEDVPTPVASLATIADGVRDGHLVVLPDAAHLPPVEQPARLAQLVAGHLRGRPPTGGAGE